MLSPEEFAFDKGIINEQTKIIAKIKLNESYHNIIKILKTYMDMPESDYKIIALWIIGTYFHDQFNCYPYLFFNAMRGSGKTRLLKLISALGSKGDGSVQNNLTEAVLFRIPKGTTTCIDEVEQIGSKEKQTLRELLNSAYKKGMKVKRMRKTHTKDGEMQVTETFEPYFPIAMANIWGVEEVLGDRSITRILEKSNNPCKTKMIEDFDTNDTILAIKRTLKAVSVVYVDVVTGKNIVKGWNAYIQNKYNDITTLTTLTTLNNITTQQEKRDEIEVIDKSFELERFFEKVDSLGIAGRNFELSFPLLIIAKEIEDEVFEDACKIISDVVNTKKDDEYIDSKDVSVFEFVAYYGEGNSYIPIKELTQKFRIFLGESDEEDKWLNDKWFGRALKRLNILKTKKRTAAGRLVILDVAKAIEKVKIFKREDGKD